MIESILAHIVRISLRSPLLTLGAGLALGLSGFYAVSLPIDLSFSGVMDRGHPQVARYFEASDRYGLGGRLLLLLEGPDAALDQAIPELQLALDSLDPIESVAVPPDPDDLIRLAPWIVDRARFDEWVLRAQEIPDSVQAEEWRFEWRAAVERVAPQSPAGARLITLRMVRDGFEIALDSDDFLVVRETVAEVVEPWGLQARFAGMAAIIQQENEATFGRMRILGPLSLLIVLLVLLSVVRQFLVLVTIALPMLLSVACTLALIGLFEGRLTLMESVFGVIVFGLGIDFAIHLLLRLSEERDQGLDFATALHRSMVGTGRGVVAGGVTTTGSFLLLTLAPDPVFYRLGIAGGLGLALCLIFLLFLLPAQWALMEARWPGRVRVRRWKGEGALTRLVARSAGSPRWVLSIGLSLIVLACVFLSDLRYESNLENVFSRQIDAVATAHRIHELFDLDPGPWLVEAQDLAEARRLQEDFNADSTFGRVDSLALVNTADQAERVQILDGLAPGLARRLREGARDARGLDGPAAEEAQRALEPWGLLLAAQTSGPPQEESLPPSIAERWIGPKGELLVYAFSAEPSLDSAVARQERRAAQAIAPNATSMSVIYEALIGTDRPWMPQVVWAVFFFVSLVVWIDLRSFRWAVIALVPVVAASIWTVGLLSAFGFAFNTVTLVALPVLLGLGVDDGIHVVHRIRQEATESLSRAVGSVARSIGLTTATTCGSVALLLWTGHPGIESVALLLGVGLPMALLATVTLIPAATALVESPGQRGSGPVR